MIEFITGKSIRAGMIRQMVNAHYIINVVEVVAQSAGQLLFFRLDRFLFFEQAGFA